MRGLRWLGPALLVAGVVSLSFGVSRGEATLNLFVIFPVITATGAWAGLGILLLIAGFFALVLTWPAYGIELAEAAVPGGSVDRPTAPAAGGPVPPRRWGGVVFLGPFPVVFGSDAKIAKWMLVAGFVLFVALVVLTVIALWGI